jgi:hypothetical protein
VKPLARHALFTVILAFSAIQTPAASESNPTAEVRPITLAGVKFLHRWTKDDQMEFTPAGQEDLQRWTDMVTLNRYRDARDGEGLAATANAVLGTYKANGAIVVRTDSVPRTNEHPAEYLMVVLFPRPEFIEAAFARFKIVDGTGASAVYSHREYGNGMEDRMRAWLEANGPAMEDALMDREKLPPANESQK